MPESICSGEKRVAQPHIEELVDETIDLGSPCRAISNSEPASDSLELTARLEHQQVVIHDNQRLLDEPVKEWHHVDEPQALRV